MRQGMRRGIVIGVLTAAGALSIAVAGSQQPPARVVEVEKVRENLFMLKGGGGNTAVFVQADGVTVVDTKNPGWGQPVLDKIRELTNKPVAMIINTHTHFDHVSGNVEFPATVDVVAQENTAANMKVMAAVSGFETPGAPPPSIFEQNKGRNLAKRTFKDRMTLGKGADRIDLYYFGRGHTNGDAWVVFPSLRVMHAGDMFPGRSIPIMDVNNGGSGVDFPDTLAKAHRTVKNIDTVITGHSTLMTMKDLQEYADFNRDFREAVRAAKKAGKSVEEIASSWKTPAAYPGYAAPQVARLKLNVEAVYKESR